MAERKVQITFTGMDRVSAVAAKVGRSMRGLGRVAQGFQGVGRSVAGLGRQLQGVAGPLGAVAGIGAVAGVVKIATHFASAGDEAAKMSRNLNLSAEAYQELNFWAERSGLSTREWATAQRTLTKNLADAATGANKDVTGLLEGLNIQLRDAEGNVRKTDDVLADLAEAFEKNEDPIERTRIATELFGERAGPKLIQALAEGRASMEDIRKEAQRLGLVLSEEQAKDAEKLTDSWTNLSRTVSGLALQIGARLGPVLTPILNDLAVWVSTFNTEANLKEVGEFFEDFGKTLTSVNWQAVIADIRGIGETVGSVVDFIGGWDVAAVGLVAVLNGPLILAVTQVGIAIGKLGALLFANPIGLAVALIAGAVYLIYDNWDGVVRWFSDLWGNVGSVFGGAVDAIKGILTGDSQLAVDGFLAVFDGLAGLVENSWDLVTGVISKALSGIDDLFGTDLQASFYRWVTGFENAVLELPTKFLEAVKDIVRGIRDLGRSALEFIPDLSFSSLNPFSDDDEDEAAARTGSGGAASALAGGIPDAPPGAVLAAAASTGAAGGGPGTANDGDVGVNVEIKATSVESVSATTTGRGRYSRVMGFSPAGLRGY